MDVFGVCILGLCTATGGGLIRDIILHVMPASVFANPTFAIVAIISSVIVFLPPVKKLVLSQNHTGELLLFWADTLGLAAFTVSGLRTAIGTYPEGGRFLFCFLAVITAVGGGMLRDMMAQEIPSIFVKKVYAVASLAGALCAVLLWSISPLLALICGFVLVVIIRFLAMHYHWHLPRA